MLRSVDFYRHPNPRMQRRWHVVLMFNGLDGKTIVWPEMYDDLAQASARYRALQDSLSRSNGSMRESRQLEDLDMAEQTKGSGQQGSQTGTSGGGSGQGSREGQTGTRSGEPSTSRPGGSQGDSGSRGDSQADRGGDDSQADNDNN